MALNVSEALGGKLLNSRAQRVHTLKPSRRPPSPEPPLRRLVWKPRANAGTTYSFRRLAGTGGRGACFRTGSRLPPRRKTAHGSLFSNQDMACPDASTPYRVEPSAFHVGVTTPYRWDGPAANVPQPIGYRFPFRHRPRPSRHSRQRCVCWSRSEARSLTSYQTWKGARHLIETSPCVTKASGQSAGMDTRGKTVRAT